MMKLIKALVILAIALGVGATAWLAIQFNQFSQQSILIADEQRIITVEPGSGYGRISRQLDALDGKDDRHFWRLLGWLRSDTNQLQAGEFELPPGATPTQALDELVNGDPLLYRFTIVEGWRVSEMRAFLSEQTALEHKTRGLSDAAVLALLDTNVDHLEGQFLPETYAYTRGSSDLELLQRAHDALNATLDDAWAARAPDLPYAEPAEALIMASIIEKETGAAFERPQIAGVFVRRLNIGMRLQTDPTVIYGVDDFDGNLTRTHLRSDTPYNTYTRFGLPPTPIALAGKAAIEAALNPADGETLFFVSKGDGTHHFSITLAEHNAAVRKYQLRR